jgi:hypothetical protein
MPQSELSHVAKSRLRECHTVLNPLNLARYHVTWTAESDRAPSCWFETSLSPLRNKPRLRHAQISRVIDICIEKVRSYPMIIWKCSLMPSDLVVTLYILRTQERYKFHHTSNALWCDSRICPWPYDVSAVQHFKQTTQLAQLIQWRHYIPGQRLLSTTPRAETSSTRFT